MPDEYGPARETEEAAEEDRLRLFAKKDSCVRKKRAIPSLRDWSFSCLEGEYGDSIAPSTHDTNSTIHMRVLCNPAFDSICTMRLDRIESHHLSAMLGRLKTPKRQTIDGERVEVEVDASPAWQHRVAAYIQKILTIAVARGLITSNPFKALDENGRKVIKLKKVVERDNRVLRTSEAELFLQPETRLECMLFIQLLGGFRTTELLNLQWSHIDEAEGIIHVPGTKTEDSKKVVIATSEMLEVLSRQPRRSLWVFTVEGGNRVSRHNYARDFRHWKEQNGLPAALRPQDLRGSHGNFVLKATKDLKVTQRSLRHGNLRTTASAYLRVQQEDLRDAIEQMSESIGLVNRVSKGD
jgi:integrase